MADTTRFELQRTADAMWGIAQEKKKSEKILRKLIRELQRAIRRVR